MGGGGCGHDGGPGRDDGAVGELEVGEGFAHDGDWQQSVSQHRWRKGENDSEERRTCVDPVEPLGLAHEAVQFVHLAHCGLRPALTPEDRLDFCAQRRE